MSAATYSGPDVSVKDITEAASCVWYISAIHTQCGLPADKMVRIKTRLVDVTVPLCNIHVAEHNANFARARVGQRGRSNG